MHQQNCECIICQRIEQGLTMEEAIAETKNWEKSMFEAHGWYAHCIGDDPSVATGINIHTHGLFENYDHLDLQMIAGIDPTIQHNILTTLVKRIKSGEKFIDGQLVYDAIKNLPVKIVKTTEGNREVFRVILPDPDGKVEYTQINDKWKIQYDGIFPNYRHNFSPSLN